MLTRSLYHLFSYALREDAEKEPITIDREDWKKIYQLSKKHDLAHLIGYAIKESNIKVDDDIQSVFEQAMNTAAFRYVKINYDLEMISNTLEKAQIRFIPLKGSVIRKYYKEPWLRTSCDIDILIAETDVEKVKRIFVEELNYTYDSEWNYEVSFHTPAKTHIELHRTLKDDDKTINQILSCVWERSSPALGLCYHYEMSDEMYYFYHIVHMTKHFVNGGCGIRPFLDIWVLNHQFVFNQQKRYELLDIAGLLPFAQAAEQLSEVWFSNTPHNSLTESLESFILNGGIYGTQESRVVVQQSLTGSKHSYILSRIFLPYEQLKITYPNLEKRKWLFPFYQVKRWFRLFRKGKLQSSLREAKTTSEVSTEQSNQTTELLKQLNLK